MTPSWSTHPRATVGRVTGQDAFCSVPASVPCQNDTHDGLSEMLAVIFGEWPLSNDTDAKSN